MFARRTLFGDAFVDGIKGEAANDSVPIITALDLFKFIHHKIKADVTRMKAAIADGEGNAESKRKAINQSPIIVAPPKSPQLLLNPICYKCSAPDAPETPFVSTYRYQLHSLCYDLKILRLLRLTFILLILRKFPVDNSCGHR